MTSLFQMLTIIGVVGLIVYLVKEQKPSEKQRDYQTQERPRITYLERTINNYFVQNNYSYNSPDVISTNEITYRQIINWFVKRKELKNTHQNCIAFTLRNQDGNQYVIFQGFFDLNREQLLDGRKIFGYSIDPELEELHQGKPLVIYE
jgi:hypothetical protein